ncbi:MAG: hypothetical protein R6X20_06495 [Phycisphaerae bacterium]
MAAAPVFMLILFVVGGGIVLVGLAGLVMLIVGVLKKMTALWIVGLVCLVPALLAAVVAIPVVVYLGVATQRVVHHAEPPCAEMGPPGSEEDGDYVRMEGDVARARVFGVDIKVLEPGGRGSSRSMRSSHGLGGWTRECDLRLGDVNVEVTDEDGRITLRVEGRDYGRVERGDQVLVTEDREVRVNGMRRGPGGARVVPRSRPV